MISNYKTGSGITMHLHYKCLQLLTFNSIFLDTLKLHATLMVLLEKSEFSTLL